ncbi:ABC transporter substrate-binding protein [Natrarchaeobius halalkaliphilus]|nr:extracellular solute-binding protein [Natrarchaeobius halalkaliphilus]
MRDDASPHRVDSVKRRKVLKTVGGTSVALSIAGCAGDEEPDVGNGNGNGVDDVDADTGDIDPDEWADLEGQEVHILTQESSEDYQRYWQELAERFNAATGAYVRMEYTGFGMGLNERIAELVQAEDPPELSHLGHPDAATYGDLGQLADHSEVVDHWEDRWGDIPDGARFTVDGNDVFLPMLTNPYTNWYRDDVFDEVPDTWDSQLAMAEEHDEGQGGTRGAAFTMVTGDTNTTQTGFISYAWSAGAQFFGRDGSDAIDPVFDSEYLDETAETLEFMDQLYEFSDDNLDMTGGDINQAIGNELSYQVGWVGSRPKFYGEGTDFSGEIRPCVWPGKDGNHTPWGHVQGYASFEGADNEAAMEFLRFWAEPENFIGFYFADPIHNAPVIEEIRDSEEYQAELDALPDNWNVPEDLPFDHIDITNELPAETEPPNEHTGTIYDSQILLEMVRDVLVDNEDPETAASQRADEIRDLIQ